MAEGRRGFAPAQPGRERGGAILAEGRGEPGLAQNPCGHGGR